MVTKDDLRLVLEDLKALTRYDVESDVDSGCGDPECCVPYSYLTTNADSSGEFVQYGRLETIIKEIERLLG